MTRSRRWLLPALTVALAVGPASSAQALGDGLARTPPMGWNSWYRFGCYVTEAVVRQTANRLGSSGLRARGYRYVNLDDCWMSYRRDRTGALQGHPTRFRNGIPRLVAYVHARGLKFGIYASAGRKTCAGFPGSYAHVDQDAATFAAWGVDYVKLDFCYRLRGQAARLVTAAWRDALARTGRPIVLSVSDSGVSAPWSWGPSTAHLWRTSRDFLRYGGPRSNRWTTLLRVIPLNARGASSAQPGGWNDPDLLQVGNGLTPIEGRSIMGLWSMMAAPLIAATDIRRMSAVTRLTLGNREVIAVDQDPAGIQGRRVWSGPRYDIWVRALANGERAVLLFNRSTRRTRMGVSLHPLWPAHRRFWARDLWAHRTRLTSGKLYVTVSGHGSAMFRVGPA